MEPKEIAERVLSVDGNIRYVGVVGPEYEILESRTRKGVESLTEAKEREEFVEIVPAIILGAAEKLEKALGPISYSVIRYKKVTLVFFRIPNYLVTISVEPGPTVRPLFERIMTSLGLEH